MAHSNFHHSHSRDVMPLNAQPSNSYRSLSTNFNLGSAANSFGKATKLIIVLAIDAPAIVEPAPKCIDFEQSRSTRIY